MPLWRKFFDELGVRTITSERYRDGICGGEEPHRRRVLRADGRPPWPRELSVRQGRFRISALLHGKQAANRDVRRNYCYYTQYAPQLVLSAIEIRNKERILTPLVRSNLGTLYLKVQLYRMMKTVRGERLGFMQVSNAYDRAMEHYERVREQLKRDLRAGDRRRRGCQRRVCWEGPIRSSPGR